MGDDQQCYANLTTNCAWNQSGSPSLGSGKWVSSPVSQVAAPTTTPTTTTQLFEASGKEGSAVGPNGSAAYSGPDGTVFTLAFSVPYSGSNSCTLSGAPGSSGNLANYSYAGTYNQGNVCNFDCTISYLVQQVIGSVTTNCQLNLVGTPTLTGGNWTSGPMNQILVPSEPNTPVNFFTAAGPDSAGELIYSGPDGTQFAFNFSQPAGGSTSSCTLSVLSGTASNYTYTSLYSQGADCDFDCIITYNPS
jgi:hypothetical protein